MYYLNYFMLLWKNIQQLDYVNVFISPLSDILIYYQDLSFPLPTTLPPNHKLFYSGVLFWVLFVCMFVLSLFVCFDVSISNSRWRHWRLFAAAVSHVSARRALHCAPARRRRVWMLRWSWGDSCHSNAAELFKF